MIGLLDTHQHLIYPGVAGYSWAVGIPALADRAFTVEDYKALTDGLEIAGTLFMETAVDDGDIKAETEYVAALARDPGSGIRGLIVSARPEEDDCFAEWLDEAAGMGAVGVRRVLHVVDDEISTTDTFRANIRRIGAAGLVFDMCFLARQLPLARELAAACPDTRLVLDHCGVPDIAGGGLYPWRDEIRALAKFPNVTCKLSGLLAYCAPGQATYETIEPYVAHVLDCFGPDRMVWGSDWPVVDLANGLPDWIAVTRRILGALSESEARAIASGTATSVYLPQ